jgi:hypothetical protein
MKTAIYKETKRFAYATAALAVLGMITLSCEKEEKEIPQQIFIPPSEIEYVTVKDDALTKHTEYATFNAEDGISFTSNDGAVINIPSNCLSLNGNPVTGEVELTFIDLYAKEDMMATNKPTMGLKPNGDKAVLVSGGEFFIEVKKNNVLLDMGCTYQLTVPLANTGGEDPDMTLWKGLIDDNGDLTWDEQDNQELLVQGTNYVVFGNEFGWTNIDRFYSDPRPKTSMKVTVPEGFEFKNSAVYLSYDGEPNALAKLDTYDSITKIFSEHYGQIPIGLEAHIIFATAEGDDWRYAIQAVTITDNQIYSFVMEDTEVNTYENLVLAINALP